MGKCALFVSELIDASYFTASRKELLSLPEGSSYQHITDAPGHDLWTFQRSACFCLVIYA
jgi:hypothetical protein